MGLDRREVARSEPPPESTRARRQRGAPRQISCIPAYVHAEDEGRHIAVIHDVSVRGALLFTRAKFAVDDDVELSLYIGAEGDEPRKVKGRVARIAKRDASSSGIWPYEAGVEFVESIPKNPSGKILRRVLVEQERSR